VEYLYTRMTLFTGILTNPILSKGADEPKEAIGRGGVFKKKTLLGNKVP